nr:hypothetical protein Iba_chr15aCG17170 [Ipomoea batatas]
MTADSQVLPEFITILDVDCHSIGNQIPYLQYINLLSIKNLPNTTMYTLQKSDTMSSNQLQQHQHQDESNPTFVAFLSFFGWAPLTGSCFLSGKASGITAALQLPHNNSTLLHSIVKTYL